MADRQYAPTPWEDRVLDQTGNVVVPGTPVNEISLGNIETGIQIAHLDIGLIALLAMQFASLANKELDKIKNQRFIQGTATISNPSGPGNGYFRTDEPFVVVPIPGYQQINAPNYDVLLTPLSDAANAGILTAYDKAQNGFKVKMSGSAVSVPFLWTLLNPNV